MFCDLLCTAFIEILPLLKVLHIVLNSGRSRETWVECSSQRRSWDASSA